MRGAQEWWQRGKRGGKGGSDDGRGHSDEIKVAELKGDTFVYEFMNAVQQHC